MISTIVGYGAKSLTCPLQVVQSITRSSSGLARVTTLSQARLAGAENITAVEINPAIVDVTHRYADYNGDILNLPDVDTVITDGRNFVDRTDETFDLIYLNLVYSQAARPGSSALAENYTFTTEAFSAYLDRLSENGRIGFVTHSGIHGVRLMMTALDAMQADGMSVSDGLQRMVLVKSPNPLDPIVTPSVLIHQTTALD